MQAHAGGTKVYLNRRVMSRQATEEWKSLHINMLKIHTDVLLLPDTIRGGVHSALISMYKKLLQIF
jgi:hypothetical protein